MFTGMLFIFAPLVLGYLVVVSNQARLHHINKIIEHLVSVILALMGLSLAALDNLNDNLTTILTCSATFFVCLGLCNVAVLPLVDKFIPIDIEGKQVRLPLHLMALDSVKLIAAVGVGLLLGLWLPIDLSWVDGASSWILFILLFFIGIQLRNSGLTLKQILINKQGMCIAFLVIGSSMLGGLMAASLLGMDLYQGLAMSSGFGWYSLTGILIGDAFGPVYGGASFMIELLRELVALMLIPLFIRTRPCTVIGYAGATAMDFTLPVIQTSGGIRCVPIAIVSGFILSILVPVFILFFSSLVV